MQLISTAIRWLRTITFYSSLYLRDRRVAHQLELAQDNLKRIGRRDIILFSRVPQDTSYIDFFLDYYRKMDVKHFIFIDTHGTDVASCLAPHRDVSVWRTKSAQMSKFDVRWLNVLLSRFGIERWNVVVEPYEFIIYPNMKTRSLKALASFLEEERRHCMHSILLDAYKVPEEKNAPSTGPRNLFNEFPLIDINGYVQAFGKSNSIIIKGGPILRKDYNLDPEIAPNLDRIPFIKWKRHFHYNMTTAQAWPISLNRPHGIGRVSITGALIGFTWILEKLNSNQQDESLENIVQAGVSTPFSDPEQLIDAGIMSAGEWF